MDSQEVGDLLEESLKAAEEDQQLSEAQRLHYCSTRDSLCAELASLLQEAVDMKWPFVPEKWQYKQSVSANDKTNLSDLIGQHLPQLLAVLKASILAKEVRSAFAIIFLVDRFLYWIDESSQLLKLTRRLHRRHRDVPIAPQLVIRQARVYLNQGKLQKAEYILSSLINNPTTLGSWTYQSESDRALVQAVSVQVRGMILQKLGLWLEAAELIWASLVGYYSLPQPDKKGIGTSLGILANILVSMNDEDFRAFSRNPDIDFSLLGDGGHRLLSAAQAAKMAVVYSQYTSLYVLTNVVTQGNCLLSYSFSVDCPASHKQHFLLQAKEALAIGLLTKAEGERVTSQQELHTFLKAAYSLTVTHKWLGSPLEVVAQAGQACQEALAHFYNYRHASAQEKDALCLEIMRLVGRTKLLLRVEPFLNSDKGSFIPDSYRRDQNTSVTFTLEGFSKIMKKFQKYHKSLSEIPNTKCKGTKDEVDEPRLCITALGTTVTTECGTEACKVVKDTPEAEKPQQRGSCSSSGQLPQNLDSTVGTTDDLGSSWHNFSLRSSGSPRPNSSGYIGGSTTGQGASVSNQSCVTTDDESDGVLQSADEKKKWNLEGRDSGITSHAVLRSSLPATSSSDARDSDQFELIEAEIETQDPEEDRQADIVAQKQALTEGKAQSLSQLALITSSSSLGDSFGSKSSWEKLSADQNSSSSGKPHRFNLSEAGASQNSKSQDSDGSFFLLETVDSETSDSALNPLNQNHSFVYETLSKPPPVTKSLHVSPNTQTPNNNYYATPYRFSQPEQQILTGTSSESSFEMLEVNQNLHDDSVLREKVTEKMNPLCFSCLNHVSRADRSQFVLSQQDFRALLAGVCHECLVKRVHSDETQFKLKAHNTASSALHLKFSKASGLWTAKETCVYIGEPMGMEGKQRTAIWVQFLHQEERLSSYVGKDYLKPMEIICHLKDVERQMTAQHYVTEFNKSLYDKEVMAQIFFIPSEALLILDGDEIVGCLTVEPYMLGDFVKLTNNTWKTNPGLQATEYGLAFGHFTYLLSEGQEVVVDLQGWVTANGKGLTYLTDPQIHSTVTPKGLWNPFAERGLRYFVEQQHGPKCNEICRLLKLPPLGRCVV